MSLVNELIELNGEGKTVVEAARELHIGPTFAYMLLNKANYKIKIKKEVKKFVSKLSDQQLKELVTLCDRGISVNNLETEFNLPSWVLRKELKNIDYVFKLHTKDRKLAWKEWKLKNPNYKKPSTEGKISKICERCGKKFQVYPSGNHKVYCSDKCFKQPLVTKTCLCGCKKEFKTNLIRKKFFSHKCYLIYTRKNKFKGINKKETVLLSILDKLFPKEYKFVGNWEVVFGSRNPDFININGQKKIIELFGNFWHGVEYRQLAIKDCSTNKEHVEDRVKYFKKYGYETLVVWEKELEDKETLESKLKEFHNHGSL
jgi:G:T-mismatch repair DNA endonuclease (very short patch repair protein)